ncbi:hypothetical protein LB553_01890 [Mesorhizobium sp. CA8]|uniref:hypothetical protein n=1 Tax=Mesorhizobium sp. CA8 TaxID=2876637 RepID=UPI001CCCA581|nr:hypothetical protein [Mesorhizobium sp. CA8]MBZ9759638.1 hypothetical protein [Mesorhizobium sp. CA8]
MFSIVPYRAATRRSQASADASNTLIPNPFCTGIVYHDVNRLWQQKGEIMAEVMARAVPPWLGKSVLFGNALLPTAPATRPTANPNKSKVVR